MVGWRGRLMWPDMTSSSAQGVETHPARRTTDGIHSIHNPHSLRPDRGPYNVSNTSTTRTARRL